MDCELYNEDCMNILRKMEDASVDLIITDPPYRTTSRGCNGNSGGMLAKEINKKGKVFKYNDVNVFDYSKEFFRVLKDSSHCYVMTNHVNLHEMLNAFAQAGFHFIKSLVWDKGNKIMGQYYMSCFEYILFFRKGRGHKINCCGTPDILSVPNKKTKINGKNIHDTEKPVGLMKVLIENSSSENDVVLDPFMGIGATGVACKFLFRKFIGIEIDKKYFDFAKKRIGEEIKKWEKPTQTESL